MKRLESRVLLGVLLIAAGVLFLLQSLGVIQVTVLLWPVLMGIASLAFLYVFLIAPQTNWWAAIPGFVLLSIAVIAALQEMAPAVGQALSGPLFLGSVALPFWLVYFANREHWWAVIPGGVLVTLALVSGLSSLVEGAEMGGVFFLGLGITFALLAVLPTPGGRLVWPIIPAIVFLLMGLLITAAAVDLMNYVWPVLLVLGGLYLLYRTLRVR